MVQRAQIIELAARGLDNMRIAARVGVSVRLVRRWRNRFAAEPRMTTLFDRPRSGRPATVPAQVRARLVSLACERTGDDKAPFRTVWSYAALAEALEHDTGVRLSTSEVGRILRRTALRPHRVRYWLNSQDPKFAEKCSRVCSWYRCTDPDVTVLCIDEKRLFAHQRKPGLKPPNRRHRRTRKEYTWSRHGSSVLLAAFDVRTGRIYGECRARRTGADLVSFLEAVAARVSGKVVVIWDNLNVHFDGKAKRWTAFNARHQGRFTFVYTPTHASWLNQIECWFSILERRVLRHGSFATVSEVVGRVEGFIAHWNGVEAHPFRWTFRGRFSTQEEENIDVGVWPGSACGGLADGALQAA